MKIVKLINKNNEEIIPNLIDNSLDSDSHVLSPSIHLLKDLLYYKDGDTFTRKGDVVAGGYVTTGATAVYFTIYLPKRLDNINSVTINKFNFTIRGLNGYLQNAVEMENFDGTIIPYISSENSVSFRLTKNTVFDAINNTVAAIEINSLTLTFNKSS